MLPRFRLLLSVHMTDKILLSSLQILQKNSLANTAPRIISFFIVVVSGFCTLMSGLKRSLSRLMCAPLTEEITRSCFLASQRAYAD